MRLFNSQNLSFIFLIFGHLISIQAQDIKYHANSIEHGTILHAFCWSFNTIREKLPEIKNAGYTAVQTSPIQSCLVGNNGSKDLKNWYFHYQPVSYNIGNYQLGSEDEFKSLCNAAKQYGIKIIVDAVLNHMTSDWNSIDSSLRNSDYFHSDNAGITDWNDRYQVTQRALLGLNDINTQHSTIQQKVLDFLKRAIADGAAGFRYDAAKHIELPDDNGYGSNFWPVILNNGAEFQYGEILSDSVSRDSSYAEYMRITASQYGYTVREAISNNDFSTGKIMNYSTNVNSNKLITWVESHDNYSNDERESTWLTNEQIKLSWALLAARASTTPLFFSRPVGGGGTSYDNRFPNRSQIGDEGDSLYKNDEIIAVNLFRNAMEGENEYLRNGNNSNKILMIERGTKGLVIINLNYQDTYLNNITNLKDGDYENQTNNNNQFKVSNGVITGTLPSRSVTVLYQNSESNNGTGESSGNGSSETGESNSSGSSETGESNNNGSTDENITVYFQKPSSWSSTIYAYIYDIKGKVVSEISQWPGSTMKNIDNSIYSISFSNAYEGGYIIFNDNNNQVPSSGQNGYIIKDNGLYNDNGYQSQYEENSSTPSTPSTNSINIYYYSNWRPAYIHYKADDNSWTSSPGIEMTPLNNGYHQIAIEASSITFVFNNGEGDWDNNNGNNYNIDSPGTYVVKDGQLTVSN
ncbi:alpha-amylase-domain-containing protein [Anaeromyces robustus]|uniref:Alpha-amylase n=1 Tax=Anaeromyces robustus TaxID=1754192 RepID=A0A1Y1VWI8_9FUNG|nr:alpha-amylase-domain-containing protein [Anaeromyces robustus]|eukprot:ORX65356.1 alpha-amylase-domain-containing protein [Anaeromyces robustus]